MPALDRSGPVMYVRIGPARSTSVQRLPLDMRLVSLSFDQDEAKADNLHLTIDNHDLKQFDQPLIAVGNVVEACWGYPGAMGRVREATVTKISGFLQLKVECKGKSHVANLIAKTRVFERMRRSDVAAQLAAEHGLASATFIDQTAVVFDLIPQARLTDAQFLRELAHKEGFDYYEDATGFHFHERKVGAKPLRTFRYFTDPAGGDVESVNVEGDVTSKPALVIHAGRDPLTKQSFAAAGSDASTAGRPVSAPVALVNVSKVGAVDLASLAKARADAASAGTYTAASTALNQPDAQTQANAGFTRSQQKALEVTLHCVGDALVEAKTVVTLAGFAALLDGNYHVKNARHVVGPGYKMTLKLTRDGVGAQTGLGANAPDADGKVNTGAGPASTDQTPWVSINPATGQVTWQVGGQKP
jgi:uncharacterized protein